VTLDFHANVSRVMVEVSDALFLYRTYPHVDLAETGIRAARHLKAMREGLPKQAKAMREIGYLIPPAAQATFTEPLASIYARAAELDGALAGNGRISTIAMAPGFALADIADCRPTVTVYADTQGAADAAADELAKLFEANEHSFSQTLWAPAEAVAEAQRLLREPGQGPVVLADTQDNPGGGGNGDTVGLLRALIDADADAVVAHVWDPETALAAHAAGEGAVLTIGLGAKTGFAGEMPVEAEWVVEQLNDGNTTGTGNMGKGWKFHVGPAALLRTGTVRVCVVSGKGQCLDQAQVRLFGLDPEAPRILAVKSTVHFRADFGPVARAILVVKSPGPVFADHTELAYRNLRPGVRLMPMGQVFGG
jgi:microcystin degradation protein MlrC